MSPQQAALLQGDWEVPANFDPKKSTVDNYHTNNRDSYGPYADIRASLDFDFHSNYTAERQAFQDVLIKNVVGAAVEKECPWIVFTAGAMGAGKSHVIQWMSNRGYFPLPDIVQIDPDLFKMGLPEWPIYLKEDPTQAGTQTRKESGYLVEIAQEAAMRLNKNVWVDGSLRDEGWYHNVFARIRTEHPNYSIAIIYVYASREVVLARAKSRAERTGRIVPESEIMDSLVRVPLAVRELAPLADFVAYIKNEEQDPELTYFMDARGHHLNSTGWEQVSQRFATLRQLQSPRRHRVSLETQLSAGGITLFSKTYCSYSHKVKTILNSMGARYSVVEIDTIKDGIVLQHELSKLTSIHTVPQLFVEGRFIGDCSKILELQSHGRFEEVIQPYCEKGDGAGHMIVLGEEVCERLSKPLQAA